MVNGLKLPTQRAVLSMSQKQITFKIIDHSKVVVTIRNHE